MLGKLEETVAMALMHAGEKAKAAEVYGEIEDRLGKAPAFGAVYTTLERLVDKGLVDVSEEPVPNKGSRRRKLYTLNGEGRLTLAASLRQTEDMRAGAKATWGWRHVF